jgi:putative ABC transport system substrate-binding protein
MTRRELIALVGALAAWPVRVGAQQASKVYRVGVILAGTPVSEVANNPPSALMQGLRALGYVEGKNLIMEWRSAEGRYERFPEIVREVLSTNVDVLVVGITQIALVAKVATQTIPIVVVAAGDPLGSGLVASLGRPGGNLTGLTLMTVEVTGKRLELLNELVPRLARVAVIRNPNMQVDAAFWQETEVAAKKLGVMLQSLEIRGPEDIELAFATATQAEAQAVLVFDDPLTFTHRRWIAELAARHRLPTMFGFREFPHDGGLVSYGPNVSDLYRRSATFVDKILKGAMPADLPVEQPTKFDLVINLKTAKALGLEVPATLLARAEEVIE